MRIPLRFASPRGSLRGEVWTLTRLLLLLALLSALARAEPAAESSSPYQSRFGFTATLPAAWEVLDPGARDPREFQNDPRFAGFDRRIMSSALEQIRSGRYEFLFRRPFDDFTQNIAIRLRQLTLPVGAEALSKECAGIPATFRQSFGREIAPPACEIRSVGGLHATYLEMEGPAPGTAILQYQIQRSRSEVLAFTATILTRNLPTIRYELDSFVRSMRPSSR